MHFVNDLQDSIDFYTKKLGFQLLATHPAEGQPTFAQLASGDAHIMFASPIGQQGFRPICTGHLYFYPEDLDAMWDRLKDSVEIVSELRVQPWGMKDFQIRDPSGYLITFGLSADAHHEH